MVFEFGGKKHYILHKVSDVDIALAIRHLSVMLASGLSLEDSMEVLSKQSPDEMLREAFMDILDKIRRGTSTANAMRQHKKIFSDIIISIIEVGERGGGLEKNLEFLAGFLKTNFELAKKVKGAMFYPLIVFGITVVEMLGVMFFILPKMESLFNAFDEVPVMTQIVLDVSAFVRGNVIVIGIALVVTIFLLKKFLATKTGKNFREKAVLKMPVFKDLTKKNTLATFSRTTGILLESGIPLPDCLQISHNTTTNGTYKKIIKHIQIEVQKGNNMARTMALYPEFFPPLYVKMIAVGEQTGTLEENLTYLYDFYADDVREIADNMSTLLEPMLLVFIGAMVALLALSIVGPIYQLTGNINQV